MTNTPKILRTHTDRFNIFNDGRKLGSNKRNYILNSVRTMFESMETQELLRTGEAYGYYGHSVRQRVGKLNVMETEIINVNGKPVVVDNVPACRTTAISIDDDGTVTHTQEIFDTPTGRIVDSLISSQVGGWSWATSGRDTKAASITKAYAGMDYVLQPNYLSLDHPAMMLESTDRDSLLLESLQGAGLDEDSARKAIQIGNSETYLVDRLAELESEVMLLEGMISSGQEIEAELEREREEQAKKESLMLEALEKLPVYMTQEQRKAFTEMKDESDLKVVGAMFESLGRANLDGLPLGPGNNLTIPPDRAKNMQAPKDVISFTSSRKFS